MTKPKINRARERRIEQEIVVDAYTPEERGGQFNSTGTKCGTAQDKEDQ